MIKNLSKALDIGTKTIVSRNVYILVNNRSLLNQTIRFFSDKPSKKKMPKGFEKFQKKYGKTSEEKQTEQQKSQEHQAESTENKKQTFEHDDELAKKRKHEEEKAEAAKETKKAEEQQKKTEEPEEEAIEDEEKKSKKKKKEAGQNSYFKIDPKGFNSQNFFDPRNNPYFNYRYILLAIVIGFFISSPIYDYFNELDYISHSDLVRNYIDQDAVARIVVARKNSDNEYQTIATIYPTAAAAGKAAVKMVIGNIDQFLENIEQVQLNKGKTPDKFIPIEFQYQTSSSAGFSRALNIV